MGAVNAPKRSTKGEGGKKPKKERSHVQIDMTPMVDIAFLLLIFFMVTTVFRTPQTMELNIPPDDDTVEIAESNVLTLRLMENAEAYWNIGKDFPEVIDFEEIVTLIQDETEENDKLVTLIKIQRTASYDTMVNITDEMQVGAIDRFSITVMELDEVQEVFGS